MLAEAAAAALVGLLGLWLVLHPLFESRRRHPPPAEPLIPEETPRGIALAALKEIDFDRETGKLSEADYQFLKAKYTALALQAIRAEEDGRSPEAVEGLVAADPGAPRCTSCGPRPEPDAVFCSTCGRRLPAAAWTEARPIDTPLRSDAVGIQPSPLQAH